MEFENVFKALDETLCVKEYSIKTLTKQVAELKAENRNLQDELNVLRTEREV